MLDLSVGLVDIVRDFLAAHQQMRAVFARHREGTLRFEDLVELVGGDERSELFRLKERCHALFRPEHGEQGLAMLRETIFDLAVGSLFHEAMKYRENVYQRDVYGPRVRALRSQAGEEAGSLFDEFEKILSAVAHRLEEGLYETESLLDQTANQLRSLLALHCDNGHVARYLVEHAELVEDVFGTPFDQLLAEVYGSPADGYETAGRSYLGSGYYDSALDAFEMALQRGGEAEPISRLCAYARGMAAYLARDYAKSVAELADWIEASEDDAPPQLARLARSAVSRMGQLVSGESRDQVTSQASKLLERLPA